MPGKSCDGMVAVNDSRFCQILHSMNEIMRGEHDHISAQQEVNGHSVITTLWATVVIILIMYNFTCALKDLKNAIDISYCHSRKIVRHACQVVK